MSKETKPRGRPRTLKAETVTEIAAAAYHRADPADVSVNQICDMAGVSKPSLYRVFGSEDGLMRAALTHYAETVLADIFDIFDAGQDLETTLERLIEFASADPKMETGCLFYKMRAGKHRLGPLTREKVDDIEAAALAAYSAFLTEHASALPPEPGARYLFEQTGLAVTQRAAGIAPDAVRALLRVALSVFTRT